MKYHIALSFRVYQSTQSMSPLYNGEIFVLLSVSYIFYFMTLFFHILFLNIFKNFMFYLELSRIIIS